MPRLYCVTAASCMDRYVRVRKLEIGEIHRPISVFEQAGGKGINVARTARVLGADVRVTGLANRAVQRGIEDLGLEAHWCDSAQERQCLCILDETTDELTELYEPLPPEPPDTWPRMGRVLRAVFQRADVGDVVTISGRMPEGFPLNALEIMVAQAGADGLVVLLDSNDQGLELALSARPDLVKINAEEAGQQTDSEVTDPDSATRAARILADRGARTVIITLGARGSVSLDEHGALTHVPAPRLRRAFPVGSGDAFLAGVATSWIEGENLTRAVRLGTAAAGITAQRFVAGDIDGEQVWRVFRELSDTESAAVSPTTASTPPENQLGKTGDENRRIK